MPLASISDFRLRVTSFIVSFVRAMYSMVFAPPITIWKLLPAATAPAVRVTVWLPAAAIEAALAVAWPAPDAIAVVPITPPIA